MLQIFSDEPYHNIYVRSRELQYADIFVTLKPGQELSLQLNVFPESLLDITTFGIPTNLSDVISPRNPLSAAEVDWSDLSRAFGDSLELEYKLMVNPWFRPTLAQKSLKPSASR